MQRFKTSRSHSKKARSRSSPGAPGNARPNRTPHFDSKQSPTEKYAARARYKAHARAEAYEGLRTPSISRHAIARKAMEKYGFDYKFSIVVNAKADAQDEMTVKRAGAAARDIRHLPWSSIGSAGSKAIDCVEYCERAQAGEILVKVAIADVDAYVPKGSILDMHAQAKTMSVYAGVETYPMLPEKLSEGLTSLPMNHDRLAVVVEFAVQPSGKTRPGKIYRAIVRNKAELDCDELDEWLDDQARSVMRDWAADAPTCAAAQVEHLSLRRQVASAEAADDNEAGLEMLLEVPELEAQLKLQEEASLRMDRYRQSAPDSPEVAANDGMQGLPVAECNRASRIMENFMMGANRAMAGFLEGANVPSIRKVVIAPRHWSGVVEIAESKGFRLPSTPDEMALSEFLADERKANPGEFPDLPLAIVKMLGTGQYIVHDKFHPAEFFCLATSDYSLGLSPNQRYADLIIQRLLKAAVAHAAVPYSMDELSWLVEKCTEREQAAMKVERFVAKMDAAALLAGKLGKTFDAVVTGASENGTYVRIADPLIEDMLIRPAQPLKIGQEVRVRLVNLDAENGFVDFELA